MNTESTPAFLVEDIGFSICIFATVEDLRVRFDRLEGEWMVEGCESPIFANLLADDEDVSYPSAIGNCTIDGVEYDVLLDADSMCVEGSPHPASRKLPIYTAFVTDHGGDYCSMELPDVPGADHDYFSGELLEAVLNHPTTQDMLAELREKAYEISDLFDEFEERFNDWQDLIAVDDDRQPL